MNPKKLLVLIDRWGLAILATLTLAAAVMMLREATAKAGVNTGALDQPWWQALMPSPKSGAAPAMDWRDRAELLFNATIGWAAIRVYMHTAGLKWDTFAVRWLSRDHVIIVAGRSGSAEKLADGKKSKDESQASPINKAALAVDLALALSRSRRVVLALPSLDEGSRTKLWEAGVKLLTSDMAMPEVLRAASCRRARLVIAMRDHYGDNITLARSAVSPSMMNSTLECRCMIEPLAVKQRFRLEDYFESETMPRIRIFNESELIARRIVRDYPPDMSVALADRAVHVLLVGLGSVGQSILLQLAQIGHYRSGRKPQVTVVDRDVKHHWKQALDAYPALATWLDVRTEEGKIEDIGAEQIEDWGRQGAAITVVYVCTKDEIANLRISRVCLRTLVDAPLMGGDRLRTVNADGVPVIALDPAGGCVLTEFAAYGAYQQRFRLFSLVRAPDEKGRSQVAEGLLMDGDDARAKAFHQNYCVKNDEACAADPNRQKAVNNMAWEDLPENIRNANRVVSDHIEVKLRAVGCRAVAQGSAVPTIFTPDEIELLAAMEHKRWWAEKALAGWSAGVLRDDKRLIHTDMIPYENLSETIKGYDRDSVRNIEEVLKLERLVITRA